MVCASIPGLQRVVVERQRRVMGGTVSDCFDLSDHGVADFLEYNPWSRPGAKSGDAQGSAQRTANETEADGRDPPKATSGKTVKHSSSVKNLKDNVILQTIEFTITYGRLPRGQHGLFEQSRFSIIAG